MGIAVLFLFSLSQSCSELKQSLWGKTATGEILSVDPSAYDKDDYYLTFRFSDSTGETHRVKKTVSSTLGPFAIGDSVEVIYLDGKQQSARLHAERSFVWPIVLFVMVGMAMIWSFVTYKQLQAGKLDFSGD